VLALECDAGTATLTGSVVGNGALYSTGGFFSAENDGSLTFDDGECTCPVGYNCKHVAAIVIAANGDANSGQAGRPSAPSSMRKPPRVSP
jgi:hypothetical protein